MPHERKVGFGLGILLTGIVSAFYFRQQPIENDPLPELESVRSIDDEIATSLLGQIQPSTELDDFETTHHPSVELRDIDADVATSDPPTPIPSKSKRSFDGEFDFLNDPVETPIARSNEPKQAAPSQSDSGKTPADISKSAEPPSPIASFVSEPEELPAVVEMFSQDIFESIASPTLPNQPLEAITSYHVRKGDNLTGIAERFLGSSGRYHEIYEANRDVLRSADDLKPGMRLLIPSRDESDIESSLAEVKETNRDSQPEPRVLIPRRVKLNDPIARHPPISHISRPTAASKPSTDETSMVVGEEDRKVHTSKALPSATPRDDKFPTLDGLEPLPIGGN